MTDTVKPGYWKVRRAKKSRTPDNAREFVVRIDITVFETGDETPYRADGYEFISPIEMPEVE